MTDTRIAALDHSHIRVRARAHPLRLLAIVIVLVLAAMIVHMFLFAPAFEWHVVGHYFFSHQILKGLLLTLELTGAGIGIGVVFGTVLALMRQSTSALVRWAASLYIWVFRGTPVLVQILVWYNIAVFIPRLSFGVPFGPEFVTLKTNSLVTPLLAAVLALGLNEAAYMCEIVRSGLLSIPAGQLEAARALGMSERLVFRRVVAPQALRIIVPPTANQVISLLKGSSLVSIVSLSELLYSVEVIYAANFKTIPLLIVASLWYLIVTSVLSVAQMFLERKLGRSVDAAQRGRISRPRLADVKQEFFGYGARGEVRA